MIPKTLLFAVVALTLAGCRNWLVEEPQSFFTPDDFPTTEADLKIALGGIDDWYTGGQSQAYFHRGWPMLTEVPTDQTVAQSASDSRYAQDSYTLNASNEWLWRVWRQIYGAINQANVLIARIPQMTQVSQDVKDRYLGAFKFHRAFNHFNAVRVWGSVPLMMRPTTEFATATQITRAPIAEIYDSIALDLEDAATLLPLRWPDAATPDDGRPTRGAANAMLADVYLNMSGALVQENHWADAARAAKAVIDSKAYSLVLNFADLWLIANKNGRTDLNWPIYRYAEVLLLFAEAENEANGPTADAYSAINQVRARAKLPLLAGLSQDQFRDAVHQERSWELAFESKRLFDLKRWGTFYSVLSQDAVAKIGVKDFMVFLPIPQREIDLNPVLGQNTGW